MFQNVCRPHQVYTAHGTVKLRLEISILNDILDEAELFDLQQVLVSPRGPDHNAASSLA